jgi:hypothetical protein
LRACLQLASSSSSSHLFNGDHGQLCPPDRPLAFDLPLSSAHPPFCLAWLGSTRLEE